MKRPLVGAMLVVLAASALAACGDDETGTTTTTSAGPGSGGAGPATTASAGGSGGAGGDATTGGGGAAFPIGGACSDDAQCASSSCLLETEAGWPGGYCMAECDDTTKCPTDSECVTFQSGEQLCLASCTLGGDDCNAGYDCVEVAENVGACVPGCTDDAQCTALPMCNVDYGLCVDKEICDDTIDNDLDDFPDCHDDECAAGCEGAINMACMSPMDAQPSNMGDTKGKKDLFAGSCAGVGSPEDLYTFTAPADGRVTVNLDSMADLNVYVRGGCSDAMNELACSSNLGPDMLQVLLKSGEKIHIFVDGYATPDDAGPYTLGVTFEASAPEDCADAKDNDFDDLYDCDDSDCTGTCGPLITAECAAATPLVGSVMGDTSMGTNLFSGTCGGNNAAREDVYAYTAAASGEFQITLTSMTDQAVYLRSSCADAMTQTACVDDAAGGDAEALTVGVNAGQVVYVFVDGSASPMDAGAYTLATTFTAAVCGDNKHTLPEQCDDGNLADMDGCDLMCNFLPQSEAEPNNDAMTANAPFEGQLTAIVTPAGDNDWFKVTIPAGVTKLTATTGASGMDQCMSNNAMTGEIDTEIQLLAADATTEIAFNEDINGSVGPDGNYCSSADAMVMPGDYYIRVSSSAAFCGTCEFDYSLTLSVE